MAKKKAAPPKKATAAPPKVTIELRIALSLASAPGVVRWVEGKPVAAADAGACRAVGRCPRLPEPGQQHSCFGLPAHALPGMCDNQTVCQ